MSASIWPERIHCHDGDYWAGNFADKKKGGFAWRGKTPKLEIPGHMDRFYRSCSYCGSAHPEDLYNLLNTGQGRLQGADWKYGWSHKYYIEGAPNPDAGKIVEVGSTWSGGKKVETLMGPSPQSLHGKWYNVHFNDLSDEAFDLLAPLVSLHAGIVWCKGEKGVFYVGRDRGFVAGVQR